MIGRRHMELMPSVSRSGGLDRDGDSLKDHEVQEEYRTFIEEKLEKVLKRREQFESETEDERRHRIEEQENVLILFRKLREGISSSGRNGSFSVEVYERSLYLSTLFSSQKHTTSVIHSLLNDLYPKAYPLKTPDSTSTPPTCIYHRHMSFLISFTNHLVSQYPSQSLYHQQNASLPSKDWIPDTSHIWLKNLTHSLRSGNYYQLHKITRQNRVEQLSRPPKSSDFLTTEASVQSPLHDQLAVRAFITSIDELKSKARASTWTIMKSAYRELWLEETYDTRSWLARSLVFDSLDTSEQLNWWLEDVERSNGIKKKEGTDGRWIVAKVR
ncbi:hypothetical protein AN958_03768 [Leucoagaricus sp. SymC.cos]|nr:hypothetical protein AN958_03768 [Leucoagaricus sp. SymC.cos]